MARQVDMVYDDQTVAKTYFQYRPCPPLSLITTVVDYVKKGRVGFVFWCTVPARFGVIYFFIVGMTTFLLVSLSCWLWVYTGRPRVYWHTRE